MCPAHALAPRRKPGARKFRLLRAATKHEHFSHKLERGLGSVPKQSGVSLLCLFIPVALPQAFATLVIFNRRAKWRNFPYVTGPCPGVRAWAGHMAKFRPLLAAIENDNL